MLTHDEIVTKLADKLRKEVSGLPFLDDTPEQIIEKIMPTLRHLVSVATADCATAWLDAHENGGPVAMSMLETNLATLREYGPLFFEDTVIVRQG